MKWKKPTGAGLRGKPVSTHRRTADRNNSLEGTTNPIYIHVGSESLTSMSEHTT